MRIVLASESPFRKRALDMLGLKYEVCPSRVDEKAIRDDDPADGKMLSTVETSDIRFRVSLQTARNS